MAQGLTEPNEGDVEFIAQSIDGQEGKLYASSRILSSTSDYYKTSTTFRSFCSWLPKCFASGFSEGISNPRACESPTSETGNHRRVIPTDIDFDTLRNILHYLYTNQITFHSKPGKQQTTGPRTVDVERIFEAADRLLLADLVDKAWSFLHESCDIQNITARIFGEFPKRHEPLNLIYRNFFRTRLSLIVQTSEFEDFFDQLRGPNAHQINAQFRELLQSSFVAQPQSIASSLGLPEYDESLDLDDGEYNPDDVDMQEGDRDNGDDEDEDDDDDYGDELEVSDESSDEN